MKPTFNSLLILNFLFCTIQAMEENKNIELIDIFEKNDETEGKDTDESQNIHEIKISCDEEGEFVKPCKDPHINFLDMSEFKKEESIEKIIEIKDNKLLIYKKQALIDVFHATEKSDHSEDIEVKQQGIVRSFYRYLLNREKKHTTRGLYIIVHGTFASENEDYWKPESKVFSTLLNELAKAASDNETDIDLLSFEWPGEDNDESRVAAGKLLGHLINRMQKEYAFIRAIAHSHGGNVFNAACHELINCYIDRAFYFGTPVMEKKHWLYMPINIKKLFNFYSWYDGVQWLGSYNGLDNSPCKWPVERIKCKTAYDDGRRYNNMDTQGHIWNVLFAADADYPRHCTMTQIILSSDPYTFSYTIEKNFNKITDISVNKIPDEKAKEFSVDPINITLHPELNQNSIPRETIELSEKYLKEHNKVYSFKKDNVSKIYTAWRLVTGIIQDMISW